MSIYINAAIRVKVQFQKWKLIIRNTYKLTTTTVSAELQSDALPTELLAGPSARTQKKLKTIMKGLRMCDLNSGTCPISVTPIPDSAPFLQL